MELPSRRVNLCAATSYIHKRGRAYRGFNGFIFQNVLWLCKGQQIISLLIKGEHYKGTGQTTLEISSSSKKNIVLDLVSRICDVVLVRRIFSQENPRGSGFWNGEGRGIGRSVYKQPGTKVDGILSRQGGFPSK